MPMLTTERLERFNVTTPPIRCVFDGKVFAPDGQHWLGLAQKHFGAGEVVKLVQHEERSGASHNHYFACVADAHANLPDELAIQFPSPDHLRRFALISTGYCNSHAITLDSVEEARKVYAFIKPIDQFSVVSLKGCVVTVFTAHSQSNRAANKALFRQQKEAVLGFLATMVGTTKEALTENTGKSGAGQR